MTENDLLRNRFEKLGHNKIAPFVRSINSCISEETWNRMLNRKLKIDLKTLLIATAELSFPTDELRSILILRGEKIIADLISPFNISPAEHRLLEKYRGIGDDPAKTKLILDLLGYMQPWPGERCGDKKGV